MRLIAPPPLATTTILASLCILPHAALAQGAASAKEAASHAPASSPNTLSPAEKAAGWTLLFDGKSASGWRGYKKDSMPKGWEVEDGALKVVGGSGAGDILTTQMFADFELAIEFKVSPKANSGIMFGVTEKHDTPWMTGPEFQVIDDAGHALSPSDAHSSGALYDLATPSPEKSTRPAGEWNTARIRKVGGRLEHYLNGVRVVDIRTDGKDWLDRIAASKFKVYDGFGVQKEGHIALQDHGDTVWYRNIKVRVPNAKLPGEVSLFNGKDTAGWKGFLPDGTAPEKVWSVQDGVLACAGNPVGYIRTESDYTNFVLRLEWRFNPVTKQAGNSGVLIRMIGEDKVWPRSIEAQLQSGAAGDFWNIEEFPMKTDASRLNGRNTRRSATNENPVGEWNEYEIICNRGDVVLFVNGMELNRAWDCLETPGKICLQSEGAEIHFRNIRLAPVP